jgi:hypothetical protein
MRSSRFCEHDIRKYNCISCGGSGICEHNKQNAIVKNVKEVDYVNTIKKTLLKSVKEVVCEHNTKTMQYCDGGSFCEHETKNKCKECKGSGIVNEKNKDKRM